MEPELDSAVEIKDRTLWWWGAVVVLIVAGIGALWIYGQMQPSVSVVRLRHILITFNANDPADRARARERAEELRGRIVNGESFARLAREWSGDPFSRDRGGSLGYQRKGALEPAIEEYAWTAPLRELSDVLQTKHGYHLVIVEERHLSEADQHDLEMKQRAVEVSPSG